MTTNELFDQLEAAFPLSREIKIDGFDRSLWAWKLDIETLLKLVGMPRGTDQERLAMSQAVCLEGIRDHTGDQKVFDSERGRRWLTFNPVAVMALSRAVQELNELSGPNEERKKKLGSQASSNVSSICAETSESDTQDVL